MTGNPFPAIWERQRVDAVPERSNVVDGLDLAADDQFSEVLIDDKTRRFATAAIAMADDSVVSLHPDNDLPEVRLPHTHRQALPLRVDGADFGDSQSSLPPT